MALHNYQDMAENYDLYLDVMCRERDSYEGFKDFSLDLTRAYGQQGVIRFRLRHRRGMSGC